MAPANPNPSDILREEILADARQQASQMINRARHDASAQLATAEAEADRKRREVLDAARAEAARRTEATLSTVPIETGRLASARLESLLQAIHDEARRQLLDRGGYDCRETLLALAAGAVRQMSGDAFVLKLSPADRAAAGSDLAGEVSRRAGRSPLTITVAEDASVTEGGLIIQDTEGRQVWDNRLPARLARLWPELRRQIAVRTGLIGEARVQEGDGKGSLPEPRTLNPSCRPDSSYGSVPGAGLAGKGGDA